MRRFFTRAAVFVLYVACAFLYVGALVAALAVALLMLTDDCREQCDLVVAFCREDLRWLATEVEQYRRVRIFSKCGADVPRVVQKASKTLTVENIANVGSCDHAYLRHIIGRYDDLAAVTIFCKGTASWKCSPHLVMRPSRALYTSSHALRLKGRLTRLAYWGRYPPRLKALHLTDYNFTYHTDHGRGAKLHRFEQSGFRDYEAWLVHTFGGEIASWLFAHAQWLQMGGFFAAERENLRRYPKLMYESVAAQQLSANEEVDHFMERTWGLLLTTPFIPKTLVGRSLATACACSAGASPGASDGVYESAPYEGCAPRRCVSGYKKRNTSRPIHKRKAMHNLMTANMTSITRASGTHGRSRVWVHPHQHIANGNTTL